MAWCDNLIFRKKGNNINTYVSIDNVLTTHSKKKILKSNTTLLTI